MKDILKLSEDGKTVIGIKEDKFITHITIPNGITTIEKKAFSNCQALRNIDIPNSVTTIGEYAFEHCYELQSIDIPKSVTTIGKGTFICCRSLQSINIAEENEHYTSIDGILFSKDLATIIKIPAGKGLKKYKTPDSITVFEDYAFANCSSLQSIDIPNSVITIGEGTFGGCI